MVGYLIEYAYGHGYELTGGDLYRDPRCPYGSEVSLHKKRLAIDFNLFRNGIWLPNTEDHLELGEYWELLGGNWGGQWNDGNHYELKEGR